MDAVNAHERHARALREAVAGHAAATDVSLRSAAMERSAGGARVAEPYDDVVRQIGEAAYRVTDAQVAAVRDATGSDKGAFEIIMSACIGAGIARWDAAVRAIEGSGDAAA
jgi:hypothetical protein